MKRVLSLDSINATDSATATQPTKKGKQSATLALKCYKCSAPCKQASDLMCDYCNLYCHLSCCGVSLKGTKLDVAVDVIQLLGWTCGACKNAIRQLMSSASGLASKDPTRKQIEELSQEVSKLKVQTKLVDDLAAISAHRDPSGSQATSDSTSVWAEVKRTITRQVKDVYKRGRNLIVSGLQEDATTSGNQNGNSILDINAFTKVCETELNEKPTVSMSRRLGRPGSGPRRLLITLSSEQQVTVILQKCRRLRRSTDIYIAKNVYINPDLSPEDAKKAFEVRKAKREATGGLGGALSSVSAQANFSNVNEPEMSRALRVVSQGYNLSGQDYPPLSQANQRKDSLQSSTHSLNPSAIPFPATTSHPRSLSSSAAAADLPPTGFSTCSNVATVSSDRSSSSTVSASD